MCVGGLKANYMCDILNYMCDILNCMCYISYLHV